MWNSLVRKDLTEFYKGAAFLLMQKTFCQSQAPIHLIQSLV